MVKGLSFYHALAADTANTVFYIENYKYSDIQIFEEKIKAMKVKLCMPGYKSNPGDFILQWTAKATLSFTTMYAQKIYWILNLIDHEKSHHYVYYSQQFIQLRKNRAKNF